MSLALLSLILTNTNGNTVTLSANIIYKYNKMPH